MPLTSIVDHLVVGVMAGSVTTMIMFAKPLLWLRRLLHLLSDFKVFDGESWGTCGYCCAAPVCIVFLVNTNLNLGSLCRFPGLCQDIQGPFFSFCLLHIVAAFTHFGYVWLTEKGSSYPQLYPSSDGEPPK